MTVDEVRKEWIGRKVRGGGELLNVEPSRAVERIWQDEESGAFFAWTGVEHVRSATLPGLVQKLKALVQPVRTEGKLSHDAYEVME